MSELKEAIANAKMAGGLGRHISPDDINTLIAAAEGYEALAARLAEAESYIAVKKDTVLWLLGENGEFECPPEQYFRGNPAPYFWRRRLRADSFIPAQPSAPVANRPLCRSCNGSGITDTGIDESPTTICRACDGSGFAACQTCEELRDNLSDALCGHDRKSAMIDCLIAQLAEISDALGISAEDQMVGSGNEEILFAIEELRKAHMAAEAALAAKHPKPSAPVADDVVSELVDYLTHIGFSLDEAEEQCVRTILAASQSKNSP